MGTVSDQMQVRTLPANIQSGKNTNAPVPSNIDNYSSNPQAQFDVVTLGTEAQPIQRSTKPANEVSTQLEKRRLFTPGQFSKGSTDYTNRPSITVVKNVGGTGDLAREVPIGSYTDWFLSAIQEQDVERTDVIETFGQPHVFTSGRFTRKITFSGMIRTTAHNYDSTVTINRVPQHVLLRNFYENFLRSTAQAQMDYFTRIAVDGDIYEGYCISLQLPRDAGAEMVMPFALTMICVRRYNVHDADAKAALSRFVTQKSSRLTPSFAAAELKDAVGGFTLAINVGNGAPGNTAEYNTGGVNPDGSLRGATQTIQLSAGYSGQILTVDGSAAGIWKLEYSGGGDVSAAASRTGQQTINLVLLSYPALLAAAAVNGGVATVDLVISSPTGASATLRITSVASEAATLVLKSATAALSTGAISTGALASLFEAAIMIPNARAAAQSPSSGEWTIEFGTTIELATTDKITLPDGAIPASPADVCTFDTAGAITMLRGGQNDLLNYDIGILNAALDVSGLVITSPSPGKLAFSGLKMAFVTDLDMVAQNPFALADSMHVDLLITVRLPSYGAFKATVRVDLSMGPSKIMASMFDGFLLTSWKVDVSSATSADGTVGSYLGTLTLQKSSTSQALDFTERDYQQFLTMATLSLQFPQGVVAARIRQKGTAILQIQKAAQQITVYIDARADDPDFVVFTIKLETPASVNTIAAQNVFQQIVNAKLSFPANYGFPTVTIAF